MPRRFAPRLLTLIFRNVILGGVRSKKFEQISPKICRAGGIPPTPPFRLALALNADGICANEVGAPLKIIQIAIGQKVSSLHLIIFLTPVSRYHFF